MGRGLVAASAVMVLAAAPVAAYAAEPVQLKPMPPVAKGIAAFPRVVGGTSKRAAARINRALARAERGLGCGGVKGAYHRTTIVTMRGPRYLSLLAHDNWYCGGAYPARRQVTLVFNLETGAPIDWKGLFPSGVVQSATTRPGSDRQPIAVTSKALWTLYAKAATADLDSKGYKDCGPVLMNPPDTKLTLWPDAKANGIAIMPIEFPHVVQACAPAETLRLGQLRKLGVNAAFLRAIDEAHIHHW